MPLYSSGTYSRISPGSQSSSLQIASKVENRIARALLVFSTDRFTIVIPTRSARSVSVIPRCCSIASRFTRIATTLDRQRLFVSQPRPFAKDLSQSEEQEAVNNSRSPDVRGRHVPCSSDREHDVVGHHAPIQNRQRLNQFHGH